jgi:hypothetical protein
MPTTGKQEHIDSTLAVMNPDELEHAPGRERENLEGWIPALASETEIREALEKAFDYRGDVTITRKDGASIEGYLYDRRSGKSLGDSLVRVMPVPAKGAPATAAIERISIPYSDIAGLKFTGRDTAAGKTFEAWVKKYWEKKAAGETNIQIEPEKLD